MREPLVSVIIPAFNREAYIGDALRSVLDQTYKNFEIIVVDDGSTDNTAEVVDTFGSIVQYFRKANSGPSPTRNFGIQKARGEYVAFLDSDDLWEPTKLAKQVEKFLKDPNVALVSSNYRFIDQDKKIVKEPGSAVGYVPDEFFVNDLLRIKFPFGATTAFMIKRAAFDEVGLFNEDLRISEDLDLLIRIGLKYKMAYVDEVLISVRLHNNHLMRETPRYQVWIHSVDVLKTYHKELKRRVPDVRTYYANFYSIAANSALLSGNRLKAMELYGQVLVNAPFALKGYKDFLRCFLPMSYLKMRFNKSLKNEMNDQLKKYS